MVPFRCGKLNLVYKQWIEDANGWIFEYALEYFNLYGASISPKLHCVNADNKVAMASFETFKEDFGSYKASNSYNILEQLGEAADHILKTIDAAAYILLFVGEVNDEESIVTVSGEVNGEPNMCYKPIARFGPHIDLGPLKSVSVREVKSIKLFNMGGNENDV